MMKFIKEKKTIIIISSIVTLLITSVTALIIRNRDWDEDNYKERFSKYFNKSSFKMAEKSGTKLYDKGNNIVIECGKDTIYLTVEINREENCYMILTNRKNQFVRKIVIDKETCNKDFSAKDLESYMKSCYPFLIHLSYTLILDIESEKHKNNLEEFYKDLSKSENGSKSNCYMKNNKILVTHDNKLFGKKSSLFIFKNDGTIILKEKR